MSERKVLNKYIPPTFDPSKPQEPGGGRRHRTVRLMTPFTMRCNSCGDYIYRRKKFNARKETVRGEDYLGIKIFRFYIKCPRCSAEITFKTDPKNTDYEAEHGATRNFEPWREEKFVAEALENEKAKEEAENPMKALEARTLASKREMDILDALDEIRTVNAKAQTVDTNLILEKMAAQEQEALELERKRQDEEDSKTAEAYFKSADGEKVRRLTEQTPILPTLSLLGMNTHKRPMKEAPALIVKKSKQENSLSMLTTLYAGSDSE